MTAASGDKLENAKAHAANSSPVSASPASRSVSVSGSRIDSRELFAAEREIIIAHGDETYRLRLTSQNKLIVTK